MIGSDARMTIVKMLWTVDAQISDDILTTSAYYMLDLKHWYKIRIRLKIWAAPDR